MTADDIIARLGLAPLPGEGGHYVETYRSEIAFGERSLATAIYYLLTSDTFSELHRLEADEVYHFYSGNPVELLLLRGDDDGEVVRLGPDLAGGDRPQVVVPAGVWQGSRVRAGGEYALLGTTMAPGFELADYERGDPAALRAAFPSWEEWIDALTR